jgi:hypothetical protein
MCVREMLKFRVPEFLGTQHFAYADEPPALSLGMVALVVGHPGPVAHHEAFAVLANHLSEEGGFVEVRVDGMGRKPFCQVGGDVEGHFYLLVVLAICRLAGRASFRFRGRGFAAHGFGPQVGNPEEGLARYGARRVAPSPAPVIGPSARFAGASCRLAVSLSSACVAWVELAGKRH